LPAKESRLHELEDKVQSDPNFWNDPQKSAPILKEKRELELAVQRSKKLKGLYEDIEVALEMAEGGDDPSLVEANQLYTQMLGELDLLEIQSLLSHEADINDAILTINAGAGGTESCDWAQMLLRMYTRYAEQKGWSVETYDLLAGEQAGVKNATIGISGAYAFGLLKAENGVHRLVRISPFDSNARRHTSFVSVYVTPVVDDNIEININPADLEFDTYRASGAGGQHVNKTESAVRIRHLPSGIVVASQTQRSQHQNKDNAMKMLKSALYQRELDERKKIQGEIESNKTDISFGSQIRSYVLHPYQLVKDHRTDHETSDTGGVLDGQIEGFMHSFLVMNRVPRGT
jgi:peptide chain release factor 2